jgi:hypothetical protein
MSYEAERHAKEQEGTEALIRMRSPRSQSPSRGLYDKVQDMLKKARAEYQSAAAMHHMSTVSSAGGKIEALEQVLKLL